jgi:hypothetical protein
MSQSSFPLTVMKWVKGLPVTTVNAALPPRTSWPRALSSQTRQPAVGSARDGGSREVEPSGSLMCRSGEVERATRIEGGQAVASSRRVWTSATASPVYRATSATGIPRSTMERTNSRWASRIPSR